MSQNRLKKRFAEAKQKGQKVFTAFLTLGYPNLKTTERLIEASDAMGVDCLELGFPFSDPLADGPTIQFSSQWALDHGVQIEDAFRLVSKMRRKGCQISIVFFTYFNPVLHYGIQRFVTKAVQAGFDALLVPDLPPEEEKALNRACRKQGLAQVYLVAPTTKLERAVRIIKASEGFIYYVSLRGVTGARRALPSELHAHLKILQKKTRKPILVGFGVSTPAQAAAIARMSQGVIVGSAIIDQIRRSKGRLQPVIQYLRRMVRAVKELPRG